jgi:hypothetical protein
MANAAHIPCNPASPYICIGSFYPGVPDVTHDVPGPLIDLSAEEVSIVFTLPVGLDPVTPGVRSVVLLNRPGGPSGPVGAPSDFLTLTAFDPVPDAGGLVQLFELFFQSEGAVGFDVNVLAVQATGAPEISATGEFQDVSALRNTRTWFLVAAQCRAGEHCGLRICKANLTCGSNGGMPRVWMMSPILAAATTRGTASARARRDGQRPVS